VREAAHVRAASFLQLVADLLPDAIGMAGVRIEVPVGDGLLADLTGLDGHGRTVIVEARLSSPQIGRRLREVREQLLRFRDAFKAEHPEAPAPRLVLVISTGLSARYVSLLAEAEIEVIDGPALLAHAQRQGRDTELLADFLDLSGVEVPSVGPHPADDFTERLSGILPGKPAWSAYQRTLADILEYLFSPPLERPYYEHSNETKVNRRDMILANYVEADFWGFMRNHYAAHFVVVDAKNYARDVKKTDVLQISNYLSDHGAGLFGMVFTRQGIARSAEITRREQWAFHRKLILLLTDTDLLQMLAAKKAGDRPEHVLRQQIESFRLGF
jgi:hypothetical protein